MMTCSQRESCNSLDPYECRDSVDICSVCFMYVEGSFSLISTPGYCCSGNTFEDYYSVSSWCGYIFVLGTAGKPEQQQFCRFLLL